MSPRRKERAENVSKNVLAALAAVQPKPKNPAALMAELLGFKLPDPDDKPGKFQKRPTQRRMRGHKNTLKTGWCGRRSYRTV